MLSDILQTQNMSSIPSDLASSMRSLPAQRAIDQKPRLPSKRKRDLICGLETFTKTFTIRPCPEIPYDQSHEFKPVRIIARSQLPLSFLDTAIDSLFSTNLLFSASIDVLEQFQHEKGDETQPQHTQAPRVLIARHMTNKTLYAIERVQTQVYSICKLASWLKEKEVADLWDPENLQAYPTFSKKQNEENFGDGAWWNHATADTDPTTGKQPKRARLSMLRPVLITKSVEAKTASTSMLNPMPENLQPQTVPVEIERDAMDPPAPPAPQEQLHNLVDQYLDAMYISKMSLAYFAKGPIARIRNAFTSTEDGAPATHELVSFLRSMLVSHKASEKKYREKLPEVIREFPPLSFSDDEQVDAPTKPKKSKKKIKLNREGMFPQEAEAVKRWWFGGISTTELARDETLDQRIKRRLNDLRVREALLQMIVILETTALESLSTSKPSSEGQGVAVDDSQVVMEKPKRKKKMDDVNILLDLLLDKLCIWQSIEQEGVMDFDAKNPNDGSAANDRLQNFCIEVIVPFYMNRLPEQARMVNKKLGGPTPASPPKRKAMKPPTVSRKSGEPKEPDAKKSRRPLGRVATDVTGRTGSARAPSLVRSATDSQTLSGIKREGSEVPLSAIPFQRSPSNAARQSASHLKLLKGREMDLKTTSKAAAARAQQRKRVQEDLQEAISALKKPNRGLAAGSYADDIENRGLGSLGSTNRSRKPANTVRKVQKDVQVMATPSVRRRTKDMVQQTPMYGDNPFVRSRNPDAPPSSDFCIPSSAVRPSSSVVGAAAHRDATAHTSAPQGVAETPSKSRRPKVYSIPGPNGPKILKTPSKTRVVRMAFDSPAQVVEATPVKGIASSPPTNDTCEKPVGSGSRLLFATPSKDTTAGDKESKKLAPTPRVLFATPLKAVTVKVDESPLAIAPKAAEAVDEGSIYDALGWNDDDDFM